jgi:hypothetical protein
MNMKFCNQKMPGLILLDGTIRSAMDLYLERLQQAIASATCGITSEELTNRPQGKWSVAEVLEHLYLTYTGTLKGFDRCLKAGKPLASEPSLKQRAFITLVVELGHYPKGRKAPERVLPRGMPADRVIADIGPQIAAMDKIIAQCEARYGTRTKVLDHPVLGPLTARQWRKFHWVHGRHHVKQILARRESTPEAG